MIKIVRTATPRGILFDKDGTLLDFHRSWQPINVRAIRFAACGDPALELRLRTAGGIDPITGRAQPDTVLAAGTTREIAAAFIAAGSPFALEALTVEIDAIFTAGAESAVPVIDLAPFFQRLRQRGLMLGIASSDSEAAVRATALRFGFAHDLDFIAGYDSGHGTKPGPGMLLAFATQCSMLPGEVAVVGDNLHDMAMAGSGGAGWRISVLTGTGTRDALVGASDHCLDSIAELENVLFGAR